jgi:TonB family protein
MFPFRPLFVFGLFSAALARADGPADTLNGPPDTLHWASYVAPVFPLNLVGTPVQHGFATLIFTFDEMGQITDRIVVTASHPLFVEPVYVAVSGWRMVVEGPAQPGRRESIRFVFEQHGLVSMTNRAATKAAFDPFGDDAADPLRTYREADLRPGLAALASPVPVFPPSLSGKHAQGVATVNFIVDGEGRVRVPTLIRASFIEFGEAALAAIRQWRFSPPLRDGVPVQVMVDRTFRFGNLALQPSTLAGRLQAGLPGQRSTWLGPNF